MQTVVSSKGQLVLPAALRQQDHIVAGQKFDIQRLESGEYLLRRQITKNNEGLMEWLQACPEKDWFETIPFESTDSL